MPRKCSPPIEAGVRIGTLGVAFVDLGRQRLRLRAAARGTNRVCRDIDAGHPGPAPCRNQGKLAGPAGHIEQRRTWRDAHAVDELDGARLHEAGKPIVVARHPRGPKALLQGIDIDVRSSCTHAEPPGNPD
jgi:hypothetical protein